MGWSEGTLYHLAGEDPCHRPYTCIVGWKDVRVTVDETYFAREYGGTLAGTWRGEKHELAGRRQAGRARTPLEKQESAAGKTNRCPSTGPADRFSVFVDSPSSSGDRPRHVDVIAIALPGRLGQGDKDVTIATTDMGCAEGPLPTPDEGILLLGELQGGGSQHSAVGRADERHLNGGIGQ